MQQLTTMVYFLTYLRGDQQIVRGKQKRRLRYERDDASFRFKPSRFQRPSIAYTSSPDEFVAWMLRRERQLVSQCINKLKAIGSKYDNQRGNSMCWNLNVIEPICCNRHGESSET